MPMKKDKEPPDRQADMPEAVKITRRVPPDRGRQRDPGDVQCRLADGAGHHVPRPRRRVCLTHDCALGNQPRLDDTHTNDGKLHFAFSKANELDAATDTFMHSLVLTTVDANTILQRWTMDQGGNVVSAYNMRLTRVQQ